MSKNEIIATLQKETAAFIEYCAGIDEESFFRQPMQKWSIAQNVKHLITSANSTRLAYSLPKFIIRLYTGKPNRLSRTYEELVNKYKSKLEQGGKASGRYVPEKINAITGKENWLQQFRKSMTALVTTIEKNWADDQLDKYIAPHPLLGKITQRELCYFTIYHIEHHLAIIKQRLEDYSPGKMTVKS